MAMARSFALCAILLACLSFSFGISINRPIPMKKDSKIVIVGGGPGGVHFAYLLIKKGFKNVTLLEAEDQIGGKTLTIFMPNDNTPHGMGAVYTSPIYFHILNPLIRKYNPTNKYLDGDPKSRPESYFSMGEDVGRPDNDVTHGLSMDKYALYKAAINTGLQEGSPLAQTRFLRGALRYIRIHRRIFGIYPPGMPPKPLNWAKIDMTAYAFLQKYNLLVLEGLFRAFYEINGWGILEEVPAFYALWYLHPKTVRVFLSRQLTNRPFLYIMKDGIQKIFQGIVDHHTKDGSLTVKTNAKVTSVKRAASAGKCFKSV